MTFPTELSSLIGEMESVDEVSFAFAKTISAKVSAELADADIAPTRLMEAQAFRLHMQWRSARRGQDLNRGRFLSEKQVEITFRDLVKRAQSERSVFDLLCEFEKQCFRRSTELPFVVKEFSRSVAAGNLKRPRAGQRSRHEVRNYWIEVLHSSFLAKGMTSTRNAASAELSACDAIAEGFGMSYDAVASVIKALKRNNPL